MTVALVLASSLLACHSSATDTPASAADLIVHHELNVALDPAAHLIEVNDVMSVPLVLVHERRELRFCLHGNLSVQCDDPAYRLEAAGEPAPADRHGINEAGPGATQVPLKQWVLRARDASWPSTPPHITYRGVIDHPLEQEAEEATRSFAQSPGLIENDGVVLSGSTSWVPQIGRELVSFRLTVSLPAQPAGGTQPQPWDVVSQGRRARHDLTLSKRIVTWDSAEPMDEVYLIAAPLIEYSRECSGVTMQAFLRAPDPNLAEKFLEATAQDLAMYAKLIGPYPYAKFALVENFWETGYGMPSFTLLGPQVIRFPFLLTSSYPHEILHNWWGNSVFVDYATGNWCEGLTAYLADHLFKEAEGKGEEYRRDVLDKYLNYAQREKDFPLTEFRSRHSPATEAVGYGKTLMLFHMLRRDLGDIVFAQALRRFYDAYRFKRAAFGDLASVFSATAGRDVLPFFEQWTTRTGAPALALGAVACEARGSTYHVRVEVAETQDGPPYSLAVPIAFTLEGRAEPAVHRLALDARTGALEVDLPARPLRVELDPQFDLFRRLDRHEIPSSLGQLFGAAQATFVLPGAQDPVAPAAWRELAQSWLGATSKGAIVGESELGELPRGRAVWILGSSNRWASALVSHLAAQGARIGSEALALGGTELPRARHAFAVTAPHPGDPEQALAWIGADLREALPGLARKLPHYGKYSYLAFQGSEPSNDAKGQWTAVGSPLVRVLVEDGAAPAQPVRREPLARPEPVFDGARLLEHVRTLAAPELDGRGVGTKGIELAADYIAAQMKAIGLEPGGDDGSYFAAWTESGGPDGGDVTLRNVVGVIRGENAQWRDQSVVLGAHYDHLGRGWPDVREANRGERHPGADDNASGVAVLLEVARALAGHVAPGRALVFAAFSGEEWGLRGSRHYVAHMARWPAARALAMLNLDTVGRLGTSKLIVLGTGSATEWIHIAMGIGFTTGVESTPVNDDLGSSDQKSFLDAGVPAVQLFSGANADYHRPSDTADKIDAPGMIKVATFTREALVYLADRAEPLTATSPAARPDSATAPSSARRVSLGTSPDMTFAGPGIKVAAVIEGSPAAKAGLQANDLILAIDGKDIADLRAYAAVLKAHAPGDTITIRVRRGSTELEIEATLVAR